MAKSLLKRVGDRINLMGQGAARVWRKQRDEKSIALQAAKWPALVVAPEMFMLMWYPVAWVFTCFFSLATVITGESLHAFHGVDEDSVDIYIDAPTICVAYLRALVEGRLRLSSPMMTIFVIGFSLSMLVDTILPFVTWGGIAEAVSQLALAGILGAGFFAALGATIFAVDFARVAINEYYPNFFSTVAAFAKMVWNAPIRIFEPVVTAQAAYAQVTDKGMVEAKEGAEQGVNPYEGFTRHQDATDSNVSYLAKDGIVVREAKGQDGQVQYDDVTFAAQTALLAVGAAAAFSSVLTLTQPRAPETQTALPDLDGTQATPDDSMVDVNLS